MGQKSRPGNAAFDRSAGCRCLHDALAARAGQFHANVPDHLELRRDALQHFPIRLLLTCVVLRRSPDKPPASVDACVLPAADAQAGDAALIGLPVPHWRSLPASSQPSRHRSAATLPVATPTARSADPVSPKIVRTAYAAAWRSTASTARSRYRGTRSVHAVKRSRLSMLRDLAFRDQEGPHVVPSCAQYAMTKILGK